MLTRYDRGPWLGRPRHGHRQRSERQQRKANRIGKLDPKTGHATEYRMPDPRAADPHTPVFDQHGVLWFTVQRGNMVGRLDPVSGNDAVYYSDYARGELGRLDAKSGQVREWASPGGPDSKPYGIAITSDGAVWYSESGVQPNTIVRFDPRQQVFARTAIPSGGGVVRNMAATPDGKLFIACSGKNKVGVVAQR